jgi:hypothetical protein
VAKLRFIGQLWTCACGEQVRVTLELNWGELSYPLRADVEALGWRYLDIPQWVCLANQSTMNALCPRCAKETP